MSPRPTRARPRSWPQRLVLGVGAVVVLGCLASAAVAGYVGFRFGQIDRVGDLALQSAVAGEPANYLIVGTDSREGLDPDAPDAGGFLGDEGCDCTDTIMVLRLDPDAGTAQILSFPRDLYLPIAGTGRTARINSAHAEGVQVLIDTIQQSFDVPINHYIEIDFVGFEQLVDSVGGVPMWFDAPVRDSHTGFATAGGECQVLDGQNARRFVRSRHLEFQDEDGDWVSDGSADLGRITRQQIFVRRAVGKAVGRGLTDPVALNELVAAGVANVSFDEGLSASDMLSMGRAFARFDAEELQGYALPSEPTITGAGAKVELPDLRDAEPILNIFRGLPVGSLSPSAITVDVLNGTGIDGQAADVAGALQTIGFTVDAIDTSDEVPVERTTVVYGDGGEPIARRVARHLTGGAALVYDADVEAGSVAVVVGTDFTSVHDQPAAEGSPEDLLITTTTAMATEDGTPPSTASTTTTTTEPEGYATGAPPPGVSC